MPTTPLALLLFIALLAPGFAFALARERDVPERRVSVFRETTAIALASVTFNALVLVLFAILRTVLPNRTPDVGELIRKPREQIPAKYDQFALWAFGLLVVSILLAYTSARFLRWWGGRKFRSRGGASLRSAWYLLAEQHPDRRLFASCILDDGSYVAGNVKTYNWGDEEDADRDLGLDGPTIDYRAAGETEITKWPVGAALVSARNIRVLAFSFLPQENSSPTAAADQRRPAERGRMLAVLAVVGLAVRRGRQRGRHS
jgi:hypothetical protein